MLHSLEGKKVMGCSNWRQKEKGMGALVRAGNRPDKG